MFRKIVYASIILALATAAFVPSMGVQAKTPKGYFDISIANMIKADDIGYPLNYQFVFSIYNDSGLFRQFLLRRWQRIDAQLPLGWYAFELSDRNGKVLARTGYSRVPAGAHVRWQSNLGPPDLRPQIKLKFK